MPTDLDREVRVVDLIDLLLLEMGLDAANQLVESLIALDPDDRRRHPRRLHRLSDRDLSHRDTVHFGDLLDLVDHRHVHGLARAQGSFGLVRW